MSRETVATTYQIALSRLLRLSRSHVVFQITTVLLIAYNRLFRIMQSMHYSIDSDYYMGELVDYESNLDTVIPCLEKLNLSHKG